MRRLGLLVLVAVGAGIALVQASDARPTVASNKAAARRAAATTLAAAPVPPGATRVPTDPETGNWLRQSAGGQPATTAIVDYHAFWHVSGDPQTVFQWIEAHAPAGGKLAGQGSGFAGGVPDEWSISWLFPVEPGVLFERGLGIAVTTAKGGGVAIRADGWAIWLIPRPLRDRVPSGVSAVGVFVKTFSGASYPASTVTSPGAIRHLIAWVDSRPRSQPLVIACPDITGTTPLIDLRFLGGAGQSTPLAEATENGCGGMSFSIRGRATPGLEENAPLVNVLWRLHALPRCAAAQLSTASPPPTPGNRLVQLNFVNTSSSVCALYGYARISLRDAQGRPLRTQVTRQPFPPFVVTLIPAASAFVSVTWDQSCPGPRAASVQVGLPGEPGSFLVPVGSARHPVSPCNGRIAVGPIE
jgi:hypothetical protein